MEHLVLVGIQGDSLERGASPSSKYPNQENRKLEIICKKVKEHNFQT